MVAEAWLEPLVCSMHICRTCVHTLTRVHAQTHTHFHMQRNRVVWVGAPVFPPSLSLHPSGHNDSLPHGKKDCLRR